MKKHVLTPAHTGPPLALDAFALKSEAEAFFTEAENLERADGLPATAAGA